MEYDDELVMIARAISAAREAFEKVIEDENYDAAYYNLKIEVRVLSNDFSSVLRKITDEDII